VSDEPVVPAEGESGRPEGAAVPQHDETRPRPDAGATGNPSFQPGAKIGDKFVIERLIGEGGLGVVVAARNLHLDQTVAIKYLKPNALAHPSVCERFLREARLAAKIRSEHVAHIYDVGTLPDGSPYMVMEYLAGTDLGRQLVANGPLPVDRAVDFLLQACEALAEAHIAGIVHRDIKPDNLFIATSPGGKSVLKILDFGISKMSQKHTTSGRELTEAGDKFGTPVYMSPEQLLSARDVDARSDVWSIGVVLYELVTGRLPFDGDLPELCMAIIHKDPLPLAEARPYLPERLQAVIDRCLAKDVEKRFQNVAELSQELRIFAGPASQARIDHVVRVIRGAGESVRPATPIPETSSRSLRDEPTLADPASRSLATTGSGVGSWGTMMARERSGGSRLRLAAIVGASVVAIALAVGALTGRGGQRPAEPSTAATPPPPTGVPAATMVPPLAPAAATTTDDPASEAPVVPAVTLEPSATTAATTPPPRATAHHGGKPAASSTKPGTSPTDTNAVINPFQ
jgi:serine/threonine protein kinase